MVETHLFACIHVYIYISLLITLYIMYSFTAQLLRTVEGTRLHLYHYRIAEFAMSLYTLIKTILLIVL